jgi:6-phosphogluconolactonase (cycloisomerase 2 family)
MEVQNINSKQTMKFMTRKLLFQFTALALALLPRAAFADDSLSAGALYTMDNSATGNHVLAYWRAADGALTPAGAFETGGLGSGSGLGNQGAVVLSPDGAWLFVCNASSDEVSVFAVTPAGLEFADKASSGGKRPISLALHQNLLYVLNAGGAAADKDNVTGFIFASGKLVERPGSARPLSGDNTGPAQVSFSGDGKTLIVTEKTTSILDTFTVDDNGLLNEHKTFASPVPTPFGFAAGKQNRIFVSEANGGATGASSVSSFQVSDQGDLTGISVGVPTTQSAACWVVITGNQRFAYTSDTGSGTISGYAVSRSGELQLLTYTGVSGSTGDSSSKPIDLALSRDSRFLYSLNSGSHSVSAFRVRADGSLQNLPGLSGIPAAANGLAAQ